MRRAEEPDDSSTLHLIYAIYAVFIHSLCVCVSVYETNWAWFGGVYAHEDGTNPRRERARNRVPARARDRYEMVCRMRRCCVMFFSYGCAIACACVSLCLCVCCEGAFWVSCAHIKRVIWIMNGEYRVIHVLYRKSCSMCPRTRKVMGALWPRSETVSEREKERERASKLGRKLCGTLVAEWPVLCS